MLSESALLMSQENIENTLVNSLWPSSLRVSVCSGGRQKGQRRKGVEERRRKGERDKERSPLFPFSPFPLFPFSPLLLFPFSRNGYCTEKLTVTR
jgi:hypothetical protein